MSNVPEGAQLSDDGKFWWNGEEWKQVDEGGAAGGEDGERAAARVAQGLPPSLEDVTAEQRQNFMGEPTITVEPEDQDEVEVLAMQDTGGEDGGAYA